MVNNSILRQLNIDLITDTHNPIIDWFNDLYIQLNRIETNVFHTDGGEIIYYIIVDDIKKFIFYQDNENDRFLCNFLLYWMIIQREFDLMYTEVQNITKVLVENALSNSVATPEEIYQVVSVEIESALNNDMTT